MKKMSNKESKKMLVEILRYFDTLCRKNKIKYTLIGGSLIGAIRHNGMIPWDDDIDVILTQKEYKKLLKVVQKDDDEVYKFYDYNQDKTSYYPFLKLIDTRTTVEDGFKTIENYGAYLDIFCLNNITENKILSQIHYYKFMLYKIIISGFATLTYTEKTKYSFYKKIGKIIAEIIGINFILKRYNKLANKYNNKETSKVISNWPCYSFEKDIFDSNDFEEYIDCEFDGVKSMIIKNYDKVLTHIFGDYMKLPPKEQRVNHNMNFYWKK